MKVTLLLLFVLLCLVACAQCYGNIQFDPLARILEAQRSRKSVNSLTEEVQSKYTPIYVGPQEGLKEADMISMLPGQPNTSEVVQYSGYVTVDPTAGRALFYYFVESAQDAYNKPLVLWLNGGPGCSSFGNGAMMELGPFRVNSDGKTLSTNEYAWNNEANILFLESPAGVGFSYSNTTSDYITGDKKTAADSYTFLVNWLERFSIYKTRDFFITGESYAGHYVPQLAQLILQNNKMTNQTVINLKGITIGNAYIDYETEYTGMYDYFWTHAMLSDEHHAAIVKNCNFSSDGSETELCDISTSQGDADRGNVFFYDIYAPLCNSGNNTSAYSFDPCSGDYIYNYLNIPQVQNSLHIAGPPVEWESCNYDVLGSWQDMPLTVLPVIDELMGSGISVWIYSGDTDGRVPVTSTRYSIDKLETRVNTEWYPWYIKGEVGGYAVGYENLTFMTIRGAGHFVPSYQPSRALVFFSSFLDGKLPPASAH